MWTLRPALGGHLGVFLGFLGSRCILFDCFGAAGAHFCDVQKRVVFFGSNRLGGPLDSFWFILGAPLAPSGTIFEPQWLFLALHGLMLELHGPMLEP